MPGTDDGTRYLTDDEKKAIKWEARPILYLTLSLDPKYIPTREAFLTRLDAELAMMRDDAVAAWDSLPNVAEAQQLPGLSHVRGRPRFLPR